MQECVYCGGKKKDVGLSRGRMHWICREKMWSFLVIRRMNGLAESRRKKEDMDLRS
jgi:hypothetical protein